LLAPFLRYIWPTLQGDTIRINSRSSRRDAVKNSRPFEIAFVLVRLNHIPASSQTRIMSGCSERIIPFDESDRKL
jgi:hypothetical protein